MTRPPDSPIEDRLEVEFEVGSRDLPAEGLPDEEPDEVEAEFVFSLLSSVSRGGVWEPRDRVRVVAVLGYVELDFRDALLPPGGVVDIDCAALLGAVEIRLPAGAQADVTGLPLLGHFAQKTGDESDQAPLFRIRGIALMGSVEVK